MGPASMRSRCHINMVAARLTFVLSDFRHGSATPEEQGSARYVQRIHNLLSRDPVLPRCLESR
jgi:hypothetical protein